MEQKRDYIHNELKDYIEQLIIPQYSTFDKAHNLSHAETVISESLILAETLPVSTNMVYTIAAFHDIGLCKDRATHHLASGTMLKQDKMLQKWFTQEEIQIMKEAVEDHRASTDHREFII